MTKCSQPKGVKTGNKRAQIKKLCQLVRDVEAKKAKNEAEELKNGRVYLHQVLSRMRWRRKSQLNITKRHNKQRRSQEDQKEEESKKKLRLEGKPATKAEEKT